MARRESRARSLSGRERPEPGFEEAIEWVKRCPNPLEGEAEIEIRQVFEADDFGPELTPELREAEERMRAQVAARHPGSAPENSV